MDELVLRGMARWPDVPAVYGWLALDRRGQWLLRGEPVGNPVVRDFISRNYSHDARGYWFFQNGPQRVYVDLEYTPFVYRIGAGEGAPLDLEAHTGAAARAARGAWIDDAGSTLVETELGIGLVHDADLQRLLTCFVDASGAVLSEGAFDARMERLTAGGESRLALKLGDALVPVHAVSARDVPLRFAFVACPRPQAGAGTCA